MQTDIALKVLELRTLEEPKKPSVVDYLLSASPLPIIGECASIDVNWWREYNKTNKNPPNFLTDDRQIQAFDEGLREDIKNSAMKNAKMQRGAVYLFHTGLAYVSSGFIAYFIENGF
ncbi:MAG: hypothetical protein GY861_06270 [bacterium]|nr:hypothetical protein [bacterium]